MISITSHQTDAVSFDQPTAMLHACHGKILQQCDTLEKLAAHLAIHGCDVPAQQAAQRVLRYFDTAGQFHHLDEENDLFPALRSAAAEKEPLLNELLDSLLAQHVVMLSEWEAVRQVLLQLVSGENAPLITDSFTSCYRNHISQEEQALLPLAIRWLTPAQQQKIGLNMAARRGVIAQTLRPIGLEES
jgi:hemerythrin-like domain-containing protein